MQCVSWCHGVYWKYITLKGNGIQEQSGRQYKSRINIQIVGNVRIPRSLRTNSS